MEPASGRFRDGLARGDQHHPARRACVPRFARVFNSVPGPRRAGGSVWFPILSCASLSCRSTSCRAAPSEALPLLRWRLKKSVPFDVDETVVSWMRQEGRQGSLEIVASVARQTIIREYEALLESLGAHASVVLSSTLATLPLLEEDGATLLVRLSGRMLTTVIVRGAGLCVYRSSEMRSEAASLEPQAMLDEVFRRSHITRILGTPRSIAPGWRDSAAEKNSLARRWPPKWVLPSARCRPRKALQGSTAPPRTFCHTVWTPWQAGR